MLINRNAGTGKVLIIFNALILESLEPCFGQGPMVTDSRSINSIYTLAFVNKTFSIISGHLHSENVLGNLGLSVNGVKFRMTAL